MTAAIVHRHRYGPGDRADSYYRYLAVPVGDHAAGLSAELHYDRSRAVIDLGLWGPDGFRGWSGGARNTFTVSPSEATPGYLPGPIPPGEWHVALGLYRVPPEGVDVIVEARAEAAPLPPAPPLPPVPHPAPLRRPPAGPGRRWVAGDLHAHTHHSDGHHCVAGLAALARSVGLDFLAVTDHNTVSHHPVLGDMGGRYGISLIPGQELTTPEGHANCLGDVGWVDFRDSADQWADRSVAAGGLLSINHPVAGDWGWRRPMREYPDLVEIWHGSGDGQVPEAVAWWRALGAGVGVGGGDFHRPGEGSPGSPTTWVEVADDSGQPPDAAEVLAGLRDGRVAISGGPRFPLLARQGDEMVACGADGATLVHEDGGTRTVVRGPLARFRAVPGLWRLEGSDGQLLAMAC